MILKVNDWLGLVTPMLVLISLNVFLSVHGLDYKPNFKDTFVKAGPGKSGGMKADFKPKFVDISVYPGESKGKMKMSWSTTGDMSNLDTMLKKEGFLSHGLFCVKRGAWLLYRAAKFQVEKMDDIVVASGQKNCFTPNSIGAVQPIGPIDQPKQDSITFFTKSMFRSLGKPTSVSTPKSFFKSMGSPVQSMIVVGRTKWSIKTANGRKFCVFGYGLKGENSPICMLPNVYDTVMRRKAIHIIHAARGCPDSSAVNLPLTFCSHWGKAQPPSEMKAELLIDEGETEGGLKGRTALDGCEGGGDAEVELNQTLKFFKARLTHQFDEITILEWPGFGKQKWKLELLDLIFEIAKTAVPDNLVPFSFINTVRELYISLLEKSFVGGLTSRADEGEGGIGEAGEDAATLTSPLGDEAEGDTEAGDSRMYMLTEYDYRGILFQTEACWGGMDSTISRGSFSRWSSISSPDQLEDVVWDGLKRKKGANIIIEMTWLITNMVGGICHKHFNFAHNYWALYIHVVNNLYLTPLAKSWYSKIPHLDIILGGDMEMQYRKLALATSMSLFASNSLEPFQRPQEIVAATPPAAPPPPEQPEPEDAAAQEIA